MKKMNYKRILILTCLLTLLMMTTVFADETIKTFTVTDTTKEQYALLTSIIGRENVSIIDPNGDEIILTEDNSIIEATVEGNLYVLLSEPLAGAYQVITNEMTKSLVVDAETGETSTVVGGEVNFVLIDQYISPKFDDLSATVHHSERTIQIDFTELNGADPSETTVDLILLDNENAALGEVLVESLSLSEGRYVYDIPDTMNSGTYYIKGVMTRIKEGEEVGSHTRVSEGFNLLSLYAPEKVTGLSVKNLGNEQIEFTWDELPDTPDKYYVYVANDLGSTQYLEVDGNENHLKSSDFSNGTYKAGVYGVEMVDGREYIGEKSEAITVNVLEPSPPDLEFNFSSEGEVTKSETVNLNGDVISSYFVNTSVFTISGESDKNAQIDVLLNGEEVYSISDVENFSYTVESLDDGAQSIEVIATSNRLDKAKYRFTFLVDTEKPYLEVLSPINGDTMDNSWIHVKGQTEPASALKANGITIDVDSKGFFDYQLIPSYSMDNVVNITSQDEAGNVTEYEASLVSEMHEIISFDIRKEKDSMYVGESQLIYGIGVDVLNQENIIGSENVSFEIISGSDAAIIDEEGVLTGISQGQVVIKGTIGFNSEKTFEKEIEVSIIKKPVIQHKNNHSQQEEKIELAIVPHETFSKKIDMSKGDLLNVENIAYVKVPAHATKEDILLEGTILETDGLKELENISHMVIASHVLEVKSSGMNRFEQPIEISFYLDASGKNKEGYAVYYYNEKYHKWLYIGGVYKNGKLSAKVGHLTKFAVFYTDDTKRLNDISGHWSKTYVQTLLGRNIISGAANGDGTYSFLPDKNITRAEFAKLVTAMKGYEIVDEYDGNIADYQDIPNWAMPYMQTLLNKGILNGSIVDGQRYLNPNQKITREEIVTIMSRIYEHSTQSTYHFEDDNELSEWAKDHLNKMIELGIVGGYPDNTFKPKNYATKGECAKIIYKMMEIIEMH